MLAAAAVRSGHSQVSKRHSFPDSSRSRAVRNDVSIAPVLSLQLVCSYSFYLVLIATGDITHESPTDVVVSIAATTSSA